MNAHSIFDYFLCVAMISFIIGATIGSVCGTNDTPIFHADMNVSGASDISITTHTAHHPDSDWAQRRGVIMLGYIGIWVI